MRRLLLIGAWLLFPLLLPAQDIDSLYLIFDRNKGEAAYHAAVAIDEAVGREPNFTTETDKDEVKLKILRTIILYFFNNNDFQHVITYSEIGIEHYHGIGDLFNLAGCYMTMANAYQRLGQFDKAIDSYNRCSDIMDEMGGEMAVVNKRYVINNIAEIHLSMGELDRAEEMYHKCLDLLGEVDVNDTVSNLDLATYYQNLAEVKLAQSEQKSESNTAKLSDAVSFAEQSLHLSQHYNDTPHKLINRLVTLSKAYFQSGRQADGLKMMDQALDIAKREGELFLETSIYVQKGCFESELGHQAAAESNFEKAIAMAETNHYDDLLQDALEKAYLFERQYDAKKALTYYERSVTMKDSVFNENQQRLIRDYQVRYAMQEKEHELELQQEQNRRGRMYVIVLVVIVSLLLVLFVIWWRLANVRKRRNEDLERLNQTKDRLISIVSHDVKTPVSVLTSVLDQMSTYYNTMSDTDRKANLLMLKSSSESLNDRLANILQWVRGELANGVVAPTEFNVSELINEVLKTQASALKVKSLKVTIDVLPDLTAFDDRNVASIVLQNLLSNAAKFSYPNGVIKVNVSDKNDKIWISVEDNGMGISEKQLEKMFRFMSSSSKGTKGETGTGIGLFVSKQLLDRTGGEIMVDSVKDQGTTVRFSLKKSR